MHHGDAEPLRLLTRGHAEVVPDVGVVKTEQLDRKSVEIERSPNVGQVLPAVGDEPFHELGSPAELVPSAFAAGTEVGEVVEWARREVVVGSEHEPRRDPSPNLPHGRHDGLDRLRLGEEIPVTS